MNKQLARLTANFGILLIAVYCAIGLVAWGLSVRDARRARDLLNALQEVEVDVTTRDQALRLAQRFSDIAAPGECVPDNCTVAFRIENTGMHALFLAPLTRLYAFVFLKPNRVKHLQVTMVVALGKNPGQYVGATTQDSPLGVDSFPPFDLRFSGPPVHPTVASVSFSHAATPVQRAVAFNINVACLYKLWGCKDATQIVPAWWEIEKKKSPVTPPE